MNDFLKFFYPKFLQQFDRYLLVNYPVVWETKAHFVAFYSFVLANIILFFLGFFAYMGAGYPPNANYLIRAIEPFSILIGVLAFIFYAFYLGFFQNRIKYYTFPQILTRFGLMCFVVISVVSNMTMYFMGVSAYMHIRYDMAQISQDMYYLRKMELAENIITRLHYVPFEQKKQIITNLKNSHFNKNNEINELLEITKKLDFLVKKINEESKKDTNFCLNAVAKYNQKNPSNKIAISNEIKYVGNNQRGTDNKITQKEHHKRYSSEPYHENAEVSQSDSINRKYHISTIAYLRIVQEEFVRENFKSHFLVSRLLNDNVPFNLTQYQDVPWIVGIPKVQNLLGEYEKNITYQGMVKGTPKVEYFETMQNLQNILSFSYFSYGKSLFPAVYEHFIEKTFESVIFQYEKFKNSNEKYQYYESIIKPFETKGDKNISSVEINYFLHYLNEITNKRTLSDLLYIQGKPNIIYYILFGFLSLAFVLFVGVGFMFSKYFNFKNLLVSVVCVIGYLFLMATSADGPREPLAFLSLSIFLIMVLSFVFINTAQSQSSIFWIICTINLFFILNLGKFMFLLGMVIDRNFLSQYGEIGVLLESLFLVSSAFFALWVYVVCNNLTKKPSQTL